MSINKKGTPEPIMKKIEIVSSIQFDKLYDSISKENKLIRCPKCNKLISKYSEDGSKTIQHRGLKAIIVDGEIQIVCPQKDCGTIINIKK